MVRIPPWKAALILLACLLSFAYSFPNLASKPLLEQMRATLPSWMPTKSVSLGLDLQGGAHLLLEVDVHTVVRSRAQDVLRGLRPDLRKDKIGYKSPKVLADGVSIIATDPEEAPKIRKKLVRLDSGLDVQVKEGGLVEAHFTPQALVAIRSQVLDRSIEVIRRRVDETGTREPVIQRQGENRILLQLPGVEDPEGIKEILGKTAKLTFHLVSDMPGKAGTLRLPMTEGGGEIWVERREMLTGDMLVHAQPTTRDGGVAVSFRLNGVGARRFCDVTRKNTGKPFAIVLDGEVISAPRINEPICGGSAEITGGFDMRSAGNLALLLRAGALPADLKIVEERTVGPSLGADSVEAGRLASAVGLALVLLFMGLCYGLFGLFANIALIVNMAMIFALLSALQATLTLPGIAGIVLTIGMAVDANVLIFERIREESRLGRSPISAIDAGYSRAMTTIIDSNLTTLIAAILLYSFGTGPVKGFAVTLGVGIITSLFSSIMVTRLMVVTWLWRTKPSTLNV